MINKFSIAVNSIFFNHQPLLHYSVWLCIRLFAGPVPPEGGEAYTDLLSADF